MPFDTQTSPEQYDLCVVGGGPAGLSTCIYAAMRGLSVVLFEPKPETIDKACGEGLMPSAVIELQEMGVQIEQHYPFKGIRYFSEKGTQDPTPRNYADGHFQSGDGWGVRRLSLHEALRKRVEELGVKRIESRVQNFSQTDSLVEIEGVTAQYMVAADGLHSSIRKKMGLSKPSKLPKRIGVRQHFHIKPWSDFVEVYWSEYGECYITPVAENQVGVAILAYANNLPDPLPEETRFQTLLGWFPAVEERLAGCTPTSAVRGAGGFEQRVKSPIHKRVFLVGDAAGYLDPITGEGIRLGLLSAKAAVECIVEDTPNKYRQKHRLILAPYWILTGGLLWLRRFSLGRKVMVPFLQRIPFAFNRIVSALGG